MTSDYICNDEICKNLLEIKCPLEKVVISGTNNRPIYYTLPYDDPNWSECDAYFKPTFGEVQRWLVETYNLYIDITNGIDDNWAMTVQDIEYGDCVYCSPNDFEKYEDAFILGLEMTIDTIKHYN